MKGQKNTPKPAIGENSVMGSSRENLQLVMFMIQGFLKCLEGDNFKLVIEVADGQFVVNRYPKE